VQGVVNMVMKFGVPLICMGGGRLPNSETDTVSRRALTEQICSTVTFGTFLPKVRISNFEPDTIYPEVFHVFPQSFKTTAGIVARNITTASFQFLSNSLRYPQATLCSFRH
jgi:hypothetical protein